MTPSLPQTLSYLSIEKENASAYSTSWSYVVQGRMEECGIVGIPHPDQHFQCVLLTTSCLQALTHNIY